MTDNTQVGLKKWCEAFIDGDISAGQFKRAIRIWHNEQVGAELEALLEEIKHEDLRTISQVITARIDKLRESK